MDMFKRFFKKNPKPAPPRIPVLYVTDVKK